MDDVGAVLLLGLDVLLLAALVSLVGRVLLRLVAAVRRRRQVRPPVLAAAVPQQAHRQAAAHEPPAAVAGDSPEVAAGPLPGASR